MSILLNQPRITQHVGPIRYSFDPERNLILEEWTGLVTTAELKTHWEKFLVDESVINCRRTVVDISASQITVSGEDFSYLINTLVKPALNGRKWITAIVIANDFQFGVSRQYGTYADFYSRDQIFRSLDDAFLWISTQHHSDKESGSLKMGR
jgi:hypothetical protein